MRRKCDSKQRERIRAVRKYVEAEKNMWQQRMKNHENVVEREKEGKKAQMGGEREIENGNITVNVINFFYN